MRLSGIMFYGGKAVSLGGKVLNIGKQHGASANSVHVNGTYSAQNSICAIRATISAPDSVELVTGDTLPANTSVPIDPFTVSSGSDVQGIPITFLDKKISTRVAMQRDSDF